MIELVRDTYRYRELIWALALKELKIRYKRSVLGFMWALLNPALLMVVLTLVFSTVMRFPIPHYAVFLLSVLLPWTFFSQSLSYAVESIVANGDLIKKIRVPSWCFPWQQWSRTSSTCCFLLFRWHCWFHCCGTRSIGPGCICRSHCWPWQSSPWG